VQDKDLTAEGTGNLNGTLPANDPLFVSPVAASVAPTTTGDYRLKAASPVIDKGDNDLYEATTGRVLRSDTDIDGNPRLYGASIDLGAYEYRPAPGSIVYVKQNSTGDGSSWTDAYPELADALSAAKSNKDIKEIWVAAGTYKPLHAADGVSTDPRNKAFVLVEGLKIYGGFPADANDTDHTSISTRGLAPLYDPLQNATILSGDLSGNDDDADLTTKSDNAYHVVIGADIASDGETILDGFTITGGNTNGSSDILVNGQAIEGGYGGGIYNYASSPRLTNLAVSGNTANNNFGIGGGMYNNNYSSPTLTNVTISGNTANGNNGGYGGGIANNNYSSPTLTNVTISGNTANGGNGGGMHNYYYSSPTLTNVTISGNTASTSGGGDFGGGGIYNWYSSPILTNVTISGNTATNSGGSRSGGGGIFNDYGSSSTLTNVIINGNTANGSGSSGGGGIYNSSSSLTLTNVTISENTAILGGGIYNSYSSSSTTITNVTISGNTAGDGGGIYNENSSPTLTNLTISGNKASFLGGGVCNRSTSYSPSSSIFMNVTISGNTASDGGGMYNTSYASPKLTNAIVWGNSALYGNNVDNYNNSNPTYNYSLVGDEDLTGIGIGNFNGTQEANNPLFVSPAVAPAPTTTGDYRLKVASPVIDKGDNDLYETTTGRILQSDVDIVGNLRLYGTRIDLGAYEFPGLIWTGTADNNWTEPRNWNLEEIPDVSSSVYIPGKLSNYPVLTAADNATVKDVRFGPGAEIGRQDLLTYTKAFVQLDFSTGSLDRDRWYMLANPLQELYAGDFSFGGYPGMDMKLFKTDLTQSNKTIWNRITTLNTPFSAGDGFIVWLATDREETKGLKLSKGILELPYFDNTNVPADVHWTHTYDAVAKESTFKGWKEDNGLIIENGASKTVVTRDPLKAYQLAGQIVDKSLDAGTDLFAIAGNPYMGSIDFTELQNANNTLIKGAYQIWIGPGGSLGGSYAGYNVFGGAFGREGVNLNNYIAPMQSFIVEKLNTGASGTLAFDLAAIGVNGVNPGLRSAAPPVDKLAIVASTAQAGVRTVIVSRQEGGNSFGPADSRKLFDEINSIPEVYTLKTSVKPGANNEPIATAVNVLGEITGETLIPLAISTTYKGEINFTFSGMDSYDARIFLLDTETNREIELTDKTAYAYKFDYVPEQSAGKIIANESRFFIRLHKVSTGVDAIASEVVRIYASRTGTLQVVSTHPLHQVLVYNLQGAKVYDAQVRNNTHKVEGLAGGVYIVKVVSGNTVTTQKVIVGN
jgi:hypothetical protein